MTETVTATATATVAKKRTKPKATSKSKASAPKPAAAPVTKLLAKYEAKRSFDRTPEPSGREPRPTPVATSVAKRTAKPGAGKTRKTNETKTWRFVIQKHHASHLHYDFRLEADGVLKSWAIPKGPSLDPKTRRLAMQVEDHPIGYFDFEGVIPPGNYGAGEVIVWDWGEYTLALGTDPAREIDGGKIKFVMAGEKVKGMFTLVRMHAKGASDRGWLLIKDHDAFASPTRDVTRDDASVKTGKTLDDVAVDPAAPHWQSNRPAKTEPKPKAKTKLAKVVTSAVKVPKIKTPMLATLAERPFDDDAWLFETKWDGYRAICTIAADGGVQLASRNGLDFLPKFPTLATLGDAFTERPLLVDGEIVVLDAEGKASFQKVQNSETSTPCFVVFDILYAGGKDVRHLPLEKRKALLEERIAPGQKQVLYSRHVVGAGTKLFALAERERLEGIMAKKKDSPYVERRTRDWLKIKVQNEQEFVIVGYTEPRGSRSDLGALLVGVYQKDKLVYAGHVGTGFSQKLLASLRAKLDPLRVDKSPFDQKIPKNAPTHWVKPKLVCQLRFAEWTADGILRQPSFLGLREDKNPKDVHRERPQAIAP